MIQRQDKVEKKRAPPAAYGSKQTVRNLLGELNSDKEYLEGIFMDKFVTWLLLWLADYSNTHYLTGNSNNRSSNLYPDTSM